ncbi:MAG: AmmeMemoRadiSam system protein B [Proteobacteria bacterium]|nr:AmmeMemoRadiSam system protein B [Pseudomonadota bacterium]MBU1709862.1 AmmeMemoRadiSam system protein B [Pseudomonadota bacterium]
MTRYPAVAHQFYPGDPATLKKNLDKLIPRIPASQKIKASAVVSPHAGYIYSGAVAGETYSRVSIPENVIILGPNHHGLGPPVALMSEGQWEMPLGRIPINEKFAQNLLAKGSSIRADSPAHQHEHSLEVQIPFLQYFQQNLSIIPLVISHISFETCISVANKLSAAINDFDGDVLIVASTDMTHYESRKSASEKDRLAIERVLDLDPQGLYETVRRLRISMCGIIPTTIALLTALELGATKAELVRYMDSGETSGDTAQVVGYAGFVIC